MRDKAQRHEVASYEKYPPVYEPVLLADIPSSSRRQLCKRSTRGRCIVPFDAAKRGPAARAETLKRLGIKRVAYDWRAQHVKEFEEEILQYKKHGLEFFAFWSVHDEAFRLFEKYKLQPQIWRTLPSPKADTQKARVEAAAKAMLPLVELSLIHI